MYTLAQTYEAATYDGECPYCGTHFDVEKHSSDRRDMLFIASDVAICPNSKCAKEFRIRREVTHVLYTAYKLT